MIKRLPFVLLTLLVAGLFCSSCRTKTDCICAEYYHPVCGDNGITYENECLASCEGVSFYDGTCSINGVGIIKYSGDGLCGFLISTLSQDFKPDTLPPEFQEEGLIVLLQYRKLNQYHICESPYGNYQIIQVLEINSSGKK